MCVNPVKKYSEMAIIFNNTKELVPKRVRVRVSKDLCKFKMRKMIVLNFLSEKHAKLIKIVAIAYLQVKSMIHLIINT